MNCLICLDELNCDPIKTKHCDCVLHIHPDCYYAFLRKSKFRCPICRVKKKRKNEPTLAHKRPKGWHLGLAHLLALFTEDFAVRSKSRIKREHLRI